MKKGNSDDESKMHKGGAKEGISERKNLPSYHKIFFVSIFYSV